MVLRTGSITSLKKFFSFLNSFLLQIFFLLGQPLFWGFFSLCSGFFVLVGISNKYLRLPGLAVRFLLQQVSRKVFLRAMIFSLLAILAFSGYWTILKDLPNPDKLTTRPQILTTKVYDRHGKLLYKIYRRQNRTLVQLKNVPLSLRQAIIAIEDKDFYYHQGLSWKGIARAIYRNILESRLSGGSTITQQLVKNTLLSPERTWNRKIKEIILAIWVETKFSKDQILQMYLNEVGFGGASYGVEEASQLYFGQPVKNLTLSQSALLAGLPASPTRYSPFGAHPELAKQRQEQVLRQMVEDGHITEQESKKAREQELVFAPHRFDIQAPHFVMYIKEILAQKYGEGMLNEGGLEITTSLDLDIQNLAQKAVQDEIGKLRYLKVTNGAALVTNPQTGEILAMVGSKDYFDKDIQGNFNVTTALRQPGSSIKPINYAVALSMGFTPATIIPDTPITYHVPGQPSYTPRNYDGRFHGNVPLRVALASSYNVPAVKVLSAVGVSRMIEQGKKMGITTWEDPSKFGLSLTLGGGEVRMTDMAVAYSTLANLGIKVDLHPILEVKNYQGEVLEKFESPPESTPALNPQIAYLLSDILSDNAARTPTFGHNSALVIPNKTVAVKTGTSNNLKDNWTIGYTPSVLVAAWVGNNDSSSMSYVASGVTGASPIWHNIMAELLKDKPDEKFSLPAELVKVEICGLTGNLACDACPNKRREIFLPGTEPKVPCNDEQIEEILERRAQTSLPESPN